MQKTMKPTTLLRACIAVLLCVGTEADDTSYAPGVVHPCDNVTELSEAGNVSYSYEGSHHTECWHIACSKDVVMRVSAAQLSTQSVVSLYSSNGTYFTLGKEFNNVSVATDLDVVLSGSVFVQFRSGDFSGRSVFNFDYMCVDATPAPPTDVPATRTPGVHFPCDSHTELSDAGNVSYSHTSDQNPHTECWHLACDKHAVIRISAMQLYSGTTLLMYSSVNGTDFTLEKKVSYIYEDTDLEVVLNGSAFVQLYNDYYSWSPAFNFGYVCVTD